MQSIRNAGRSLSITYLVLFSFLGYLLLAILFPLVPNYDHQPVADIYDFAPTLVGGLLYALLILSLFTLHFMLVGKVLSGSRPSLLRVSGVTLLFSLPLVFMYPINANDIYRYVFRGLISSQYHQNPYLVPPTEFAQDLPPALAGEWAGVTSPYGPLWELVAAQVTAVGRDDLLLNLLLFKLLGVLLLVAAALILWRLMGQIEKGGRHSEDRRMAFTVLWAWNPALLLTFVANAHNDALMIVVLLLGWSTLILGYAGPGLLLMFAAALVKPIALLALPIAFLYAWRTQPNAGTQVRLLLWTAVGGVLLLLAAFLPFGNPLPLVTRLLAEASAGASFSPVTLLILAAREFSLPVSFAAAMRLATTFLIGAYLWILWRTWRGASVGQSVGFAFWTYLLSALSFRIWYAAWPFPWLLADAYKGAGRSAYWLRASLWFLVTSQLSVVIYSHIRLSLLGGSQLLAHLLGVLFVFVLPFILAYAAPLLPSVLADARDADASLV